MGILFKNIKNKVITSFINNKYVYIKTDKERYKKLEPDQIDTCLYKKEKKLNIQLDENENIKSIFSMILPENF